MPKQRRRRTRATRSTAQTPVRRSQRATTRAATRSTESRGSASPTAHPRSTSQPLIATDEALDASFGRLLRYIREEVRTEMAASSAAPLQDPAPVSTPAPIQELDRPPSGTHTGYGLGQMPPPSLLTCVAVASTVHQSVSWPNTSTSTPALAWSAVSASMPTITSSAALAPTVSGTQQPMHPQPSAHLPSGGLILSPAGEVLPKKLVDKIRTRQFVEMRELLADNIALLQQLEATQGHVAVQAVGVARPRLREVSSLASWCYCFMGYMAALTTDPATRDQLAYARLLIREAQRHGGQGWLDYDRAFRQQAAADPSIPWNTLNPGLQAATLLTQRPSGQVTFCTLCRMVDHSRSQCALQYLEPAQSAMPTQRSALSATGRRTRSQVCYSWNRGSCSFPGRCTFRHVCSSCYSPNHKASDCPQSQDDPQAKQGTTPHLSAVPTS